VLPLQIAVAVPALVVEEHRLQHQVVQPVRRGAQDGPIAQQVEAYRHVRAQYEQLGIVQGALLRQEIGREGDLAEIVHVAGDPERADLVAGELHAPRQGEGMLRGKLRVEARVAVPRI
jgi:hypothetical protein